MLDRPSDHDLDARLRQMAHAALAEHAAAVDSEADLIDLRARLHEERVTTSSDGRAVTRRWLAVAAATVLVGGGVAGIIAWSGGAHDSVSTPVPPEVSPHVAETAPRATDPAVTVPSSPTSTSASELPTESVPGTSTPTTSLAPADGSAVAEPSIVLVGASVRITPAGTVERACDFLIRTTRLDGPDSGQVGSFSSGSWSPGAPRQLADYYCAETGFEMVTDEPLEVLIPRNMPRGSYELCLTANRDPAGCAPVTVERPVNEASADPALVTVGEVVTMTPANMVQRACQDIVTVIPLDNPVKSSGQLADGRWLPAPGPATDITYPPCVGEVSDRPVEFVVAPDTPPGVYAMCLVEQASYAIQESSDPGCAVVTVNPLPLPACWTEPVAPPTLSDGSDPGSVAFDPAGRAVWGDPATTAVVYQTLGSEPSSFWLDEMPDSVPQVSSGTVRAAVGIAGDFEGGPKIILVRGKDGCDRHYEVGPLPMEDAVALAQAWVDRLAASTPPPTSAISRCSWKPSVAGHDGAGGRVASVFSLTNVSDAPCQVPALISVNAVGGDGNLLASGSPGGFFPVDPLSVDSIGAGERADFVLTTSSDACGNEEALASTVQVTLDDGTRFSVTFPWRVDVACGLEYSQATRWV